MSISNDSMESSDTEEECSPQCEPIPLYGSYVKSREELSDEWLLERNGISLDSAYARVDYWWHCAADPCGCHIYRNSIANRMLGIDCPYCRGWETCTHNNLTHKFPRLIPYWSKENSTSIEKHPIRMTHVMHWSCSSCGTNWSERLSYISRRINTCLICWHKKSKETKSKQSDEIRRRKPRSPLCKQNLLSYYPQFVALWSDKNRHPPEEYSLAFNYCLWWICPQCHHEWRNKISIRVRSKCPKCRQ